MERSFKVGEKVYIVQISSQTQAPEAGECAIKATVDGKEIEISLNRVANGEFIINKAGKQTRLFLAQGKSGEIFVHRQGRVYTVAPVEKDFGAGENAGPVSSRLVATMPGKILKVLVELGQTVEKNQPVLIMESMKMEMTQTVHFHGKVEEICVKAGDQVNAGALMVRIEPTPKDN
ncbi:MAG: hypothetical protein HQM09_13685 [Candidatus Riflebacteria bacterium]|nr:hypothetical protein [Candidatus Riflebacteria bacterium]